MVDADLGHIASQEIGQAAVVQTWIRGELVYQAAEYTKDELQRTSGRTDEPETAESALGQQCRAGGAAWQRARC